MSTDIEKMARRRKNVPGGLELAARIRGGATVAGLAAEYGVSKSTVARSVNDAGLSTADGLSVVQIRPDAVARTPVASHGWLGYTEELDGAACVGHLSLGPDAWFPQTVGERRTTGAEAVGVCGGCPVRVRCLERALEEEVGDALRHGIRGGMDEDERAALVEGVSA